MISKTIANCTPAEFMAQAYRVAEKAGDLFAKSEVLALRKRAPRLTGKESEEESKELFQKQARENIMEMLRVLMTEYPTETSELLGLMAFIEPEDLDKHTGMELLGVGISVLTNKDILDFLSFAGK